MTIMNKVNLQHPTKVLSSGYHDASKAFNDLQEIIESSAIKNFTVDDKKSALAEISENTTGGFINRNPARRSTTAESKALAADIVDLPARSTLGAGASSSSRDTVVAPDPSRDSIRAD